MARLLVVEDSGELAALIAAAASSRGHSARTAFSGEGALQALEAERFDVAIVDLNLRDEAPREILARLAALGVPAIAMSAKRGGSGVTVVPDQPVHAYFEKPFAMSSLLQAIEGASDVIVTLEVGEMEMVEADDAFSALATQAATQPSAFEAGFTGPLGPGGVPRLFLALARDRDSGQVLLRSGEVTHWVDFDAGQPVAVHSTRFEDGFAAFCLAQGRIHDDVLPAIIELTGQGYTPAEAMLRLSLISDAERRSLEAAHLRAVLHASFFWPEGEYAISRGSAPATPAPSGPGHRLPVDFVFEGLLQPQPLDWLRQMLPADRRLHPTPEADFAHHQITLTPAQATLLSHADGAKTVADLRLLADLSEAKALVTLLAFMHLGFLEERPEALRSDRISFGL